MQTDNRYDRHGDYTGESWGQLFYDNPEHNFKARISLLGRLSTDIYRKKQQIYQASMEKSFTAVPLTLRAGRFEKSDNLGLYLLDGAEATYSFKQQPLTVEVYGGRPLRIDHVRSVQGNFVAGVEGLLKLQPQLTLGDQVLHISALDLRAGFQAAQRELTEVADDVLVMQGVDDNGDVIEQRRAGASQKKNISTYRLNGAVRLAGHLLGQDKPLEMFFKGSYSPEKNQLENAFVDSWWDAFKNVRLRSYFEAYRPRQRFVTFRDRFYSAYALGEQQVWRGSVEHNMNDSIRYSVGAQYADRDKGYSGYGFNSSVGYTFKPGVTVSATVDYLELSSREHAASLYLSGSHALSPKLRYSLSLALRDEKKTLYGNNFAKGVETEWQYMVKNDLVMAFKASYIANSGLNDEYLGSMQLTYYFDRFQAGRP